MSYLKTLQFHGSQGIVENGKGSRMFLQLIAAQDRELLRPDLEGLATFAAIFRANRTSPSENAGEKCLAL
jgi:hypothetical protein